ncbi:hypothetical protein [Jiella sp. M17.18]|uniref:hypothetical protein n=1 Tax=Jiella sp. M17.18 TaxID=3234247 RepID=UPI0034DE372D
MKSRHDNLPLVDMSNVPDVYASGTLPIDDLGDGMVRVSFYSVQRGICGNAERIVQVKVVMSRFAVLDLAMAAAAPPEPLAVEEPVLRN